MNISSDRKIVAAAKRLITAFDEYLGEAFWNDIRHGAAQGDPICIPLLDLHNAVKGK